MQAPAPAPRPRGGRPMMLALEVIDGDERLVVRGGERREETSAPRPAERSEKPLRIAVRM